MRTVTGVRAVPHLLGGRITLTWQNPPPNDFGGGAAFAGIRIVRRERTFPLAEDDGVTVYGAGAPAGPITTHFDDDGVTPLTRYYYTVFAVDGAPTPAYYADDGSRAEALATADYGLTQRLYKLLPAVHQRHDRLGEEEWAQFSPEVVAALKALPPGLRDLGPLARFFRAAAAPLNLMRSTAEGLRQLHDANHAPAAYLQPLAHWVGWETDRTLPVYAQRGEIKSAPHLYRGVGTAPNLRAIVTRYTGWHSQVAEFEQHLVRSNMPPQLNVFAAAAEEGAGGWRGIDDAAAALGFGDGNDEAAGGVSLPAVLVSATAEPFALRPDLELAVTTDDRIPVVVRLKPGDFEDISAATAAEVARVLGDALSELTAAARADGRVVLSSHTVGPAASLRVEQYRTSLVTLEGATRGRLSVFVNRHAVAPARLRLFYETNDPDAARTERVAVKALSGEPFPTGLAPGEEAPASPQSGADAYLPSPPQGVVSYKTFRRGAWGESQPAPNTPGAAQSDPAAVELPNSGGAVLLAWVDTPNLPHSAAAALGFPVGNDEAAGVGALPATLTGDRAGPFGLRAGMEVTITANRGRPVVVRFRPNEFADIGAATAAEVAAVLNGALTHVRALVADGRVVLRTASVGPDAFLSVENRPRIRFALGKPAAPRPARLAGQRGEPFPVAPGTHLVLRGKWAGEVTVEFSAADFAVRQRATAAEVANVINARQTRVQAFAQPNGAVLLETPGAGGDERLEIDLRHSSAAAALGFSAENGAAEGDWGDRIEWDGAREVTAARAGRHSDLSAAVDGAGRVWLFWATHSGMNWRVMSSRWNGTNWSAAEVLADGLGGNREPCPVLDAAGRIWLFWSRRAGVGTPEDSWEIHRRVFNPVGGAWGFEEAVTTVPAGGRACDREPGAVLLPSGDLRVFFRSDRDGGPGLWAVTVNRVTGLPGPLGAVTTGAAADHAPAPLFLPDGKTLWLLYRSDRSVPLSRVAARALPRFENRITSAAPASASAPAGPIRSLRMSDAGTLRRYAGSTTVVNGDMARIRRRRLWDDLLSYTPQKPSGWAAGELLRDDEFYTRGTVGLYLSQLIPDSPLSQSRVKRLLPVLERFLPINVRVVVVLAPRVDIEFVYGPDRDLEESYQDKHPFIEYYAGPGEDALAPPPELDVLMLLSNTPGNVSADPARPLTMRRRTFFPPWR